jgi:hypothetical protein
MLNNILFDITKQINISFNPRYSYYERLAIIYQHNIPRVTYEQIYFFLINVQLI